MQMDIRKTILGLSLVERDKQPISKIGMLCIVRTVC